jgi:hypothetical protein
MAAVSFALSIKPYFSNLDRAKMLDAKHTGGRTLDLWSAADCKDHFSAILRAITSKKMPPAGDPAVTDGPWEQVKIDRFENDFTAWKNGGFQP